MDLYGKVGGQGRKIAAGRYLQYDPVRMRTLQKELQPSGQWLP